MEQKKIEHSRRVKARDSIQAKRVKQLLYTLDSHPPKPLSARLQEQLIGSDGLRHLAAAMTILLIDYGGTTPSATCEVIAEDAPSLYRAWGFRRVLAACEAIQHSEIPEQSRLYQRMFQRFNIRYFADRLPDYKILGIGELREVDMHRASRLLARRPDLLISRVARSSSDFSVSILAV